MSEADSSNKDPGLPESIEPAAYADAEPSGSLLGSQPADEGWQTINFPGAVSVDAIPVDTASPCDAPAESADMQATAPLSEVDELVADEAVAEELVPEDFEAQVEHLRQENAELRDRLAQLEQDLFQGQIQWQLEAARSAQEETAEAVHPDLILAQQELAAAQERIGYLFQELELSHQAAQRQQILVETLTEQLESSQERIAQLERDCTLTQQRYNEQVQQVLQAENTCRDLRMRLHRQQQHTLQFKAALEKCLEMPAPYGQNHFVSEFDAGNPSAALTPPNSSLGRLLAGKNQPVKPWSAPISPPPAAFSTPTADQPILPKPLSKLIHTESDSDDEAITSSWSVLGNGNPLMPEDVTSQPAAESSDVTELINLIFPDNANSAENQAYSAEEQANAIFDVSPFLEPGASSESTLPEYEPVLQYPDSFQDTEGLMRMLNSVPFSSEQVSELSESDLGQVLQPADDPLWNDLAKLIDPTLTTEGGTPVNSEAVSPEFASPELASAQPTVETGNVETGTVETGNSSENVTPVPLSESEPVESPSGSQPAKEDAPARKRLESLNWAPRSSRPLGREATSAPAKVALAKASPAKAAPTKSQIPAFAAVAAAVKQTEVAGMSAPTGEPLPPNWPSPIVYPLRSSKKLSSLAAVELPTFPRPR